VAPVTEKYGCPRAARLAPHRRGRGEREAWVLAAVIIIVLQYATQRRVLIKHGHRLGKMKQVHVSIQGKYLLYKANIFAILFVYLLYKANIFAIFIVYKATS
jgi:hypothetical protein